MKGSPFIVNETSTASFLAQGYEDFMKTHATFYSIFRLLLVTVVGTGLGLLAWRLMGPISWNRNTDWIADLVFSTLLPILSLAWGCSIVVYCALLASSSTRPLGIEGLIITLTLWLCMTLVIVGVYYSSGTAYTNHIRVVIESAYLASGWSFGFILAPILIIRTIRLVRTWYRNSHGVQN